MADRIPYGDAVDARVRAEMRKLWTLLHPAGQQHGAVRRVFYGGATTAVVAAGAGSAQPPIVVGS